jgi:hypothetical protein
MREAEKGVVSVVTPLGRCSHRELLGMVHEDVHVAVTSIQHVDLL